MLDLLFHQQALFQLQVGCDIGGLIADIDDHAGLCTARLFDIFNKGVVDRHLRGVGGFGVGCCQNGCLMQGAVGNLFALAEYHRMGAGDVFGVEPHIPTAGFLEGELVVLQVVASDQNGEAVVGEVALGCKAGFLAFFGGNLPLAAQVTLFHQLAADGRKLVVGLGAGERIKDRIDVFGFLLTFFNQLAQLFLGGVRLAVFAVVFLCVLGRRFARVPAGW